jgi:hypothetical protein
MTYHFLTADGHTCCRTNSVKALCPRCKARMMACELHDDVPSLIDRMRASRGLPMLEVHAGFAVFQNAASRGGARANRRV